MKVKFFTTTRTDRQLALLLFAMIFGLYVRTLAPGLLGGDSGEFQVAAWTLGLAHPTGYPLYLLLGSLWQHLWALFGLSPAYALNLLSAVFGALTVATLYLALMHWLQGPLAVRRLAALLGALFLAVNPTFWSQSLIAEVYTLHALFVVLILHIAYTLLQAHRPGQAETTQERAEAWALALWLSLLVGLALTHHAMTLLLLPAVLLALWWSSQAWLTSMRRLGLLFLVAVAPLLLYLYIPLRSGPGPSPWYHQALGGEVLTLYQNNFAGFWHFITGQSIAVGFRDFSGAWAQLPQAWLLWRLHFFLPGLVMVGLGLYLLWRARNWPLLLLTVPFFLLQQLFNLYYAIGDILVYYTPLYVVAAIWAAFTADLIYSSFARLERQSEEADTTEGRLPALAISLVLGIALLWLPLQIARAYFPQLDQSVTTRAQQQWDAIVAAAPSANAILISNDRNEIVPLFYYQAVEGKLPHITGLFPLIEPSERFADIGTTLDTALDGVGAGGTGAVYLIKAMPGLAVKYRLEPATPPLVTVQRRPAPMPTVVVDQPYGPLQFLGFDQAQVDGAVLITLYWQVNQPVAGDLTTTVQLLGTQGAKLAQHDAPPGGVYYPTSLWKPGELLVEEQRLVLAAAGDLANAATLLIGMYDPITMAQLAPPLTIEFVDRS